MQPYTRPAGSTGAGLCHTWLGDPVKQLLLELQAMAAPFRTGTHVFTTHDGERMVYYTLGDPANPTVLLLHGCTYRPDLSQRDPITVCLSAFAAGPAPPTRV